MRTSDHSYTSRFLVLATGVLSAAQMPQIEGLSQFSGLTVHTAAWPDNLSFAGMRVGVIGTGSSATQLIPIVAKECAELTVFQRTANFVMPAQNRPLSAEEDREWKSVYPAKRAIARSSSNGHNQTPAPGPGRQLTKAQREEEFERRWQAGGLYMMRAFTDIMSDPIVNQHATDFVSDKIRSIVADPETADKLVPKDLPIGTKRLCSGTGYYETFNMPHVSLVDINKTPIVTITERGIQTSDTTHELDAIILATGFDAMTGSFLRIDVRGRQRASLSEAWSDGPRTYLGVAVAGFPNMFLLSGPQSPSVFSNMVTTSEQHAEWVTRAITRASESDLVVEAKRPDQEAWVAHVTQVASQTLYADSRNSWFWGANTPGKPRVFMPYAGGVHRYQERLRTEESDGYPGFNRNPSTASLSDGPGAVGY